MALSLEMMEELKVDFDMWGKYKFSDLILAGEKKADGQCVSVFMDTNVDKRRLVCLMGAAALGAVGVSFWELYEEAVNWNRVEISDIISGAVGYDIMEETEEYPQGLFVHAEYLNDKELWNFSQAAKVFRANGQ